MEEINKKCRDCEGRGRWQISTLLADGTYEYTWHYCESCQGVGVSQDPEDGDDFDIGGSSFVEED